jgi:protease IV
VKNLFAKISSFLTGLRVWTVNLLTLALVVYLVGGLVFMLVKMPGKVDPQGKVLILNPEGLVKEQEVFPSDPLGALGMEEEQLQTRDLVKLIRAASADEQLAGVLLDFSKTRFSGAGTALLLAEELKALKASGKPVIAYSEAMGTSSYLMATQADEVYLHPSGALALSGIGGYRNYTRELTDKLKITIHNYSQGEFKSAVEGMTRTDMSEPDRLQREELYGPIWDALKTAIAESRGVQPDMLQDFADNRTAPLFAEAGYSSLAHAQEQGLIDGTRTFPELRDLMIERFGRSDEEEERVTYPHISWRAYQAQLPEEDSSAEDAVAVVFVEGAIQQGEQAPGVAGSADIAPLLRKAHESKSTRALVLRVNSPGGSIIASDLIRDELVAAQKKGLPVIVSMGDVAASGGVWVSTPGDKIYAEPTTITGSIGVAVVFPTIENTLDYIGINADGVTTSKNAAWGLHLPVDEQLDAIFARWASDAYEHFVATVADSRSKEEDYIRSIAGGRVWLAPKAVELGLVDELGTLEDAVAYAASQADLDEYRVDYVTKPVSPAIALLRRFSVSAGMGPGSSYQTFAARMDSLFTLFGDISEPKATVMCAECMVEML